MSADPDAPRLSAAFAALQAGRADEVLRVVGASADDPGARPEWITLRALALARLRRAAEALPLFERLAALEPDVPEHLSNFGNALCELGRETEALAVLARARALGADDAGTWFASARAAAACGRREEALAHATRAIDLAPRDPELRLLRARIRLALDDWEGANSDIDALRRGALDLEQALSIAGLMVELGLHGDAGALFERIHAQAPAEPRAVLGLARLAERANRLDAARTWRARLAPEAEARLAPDDTFALLRLDARLAQRAGDSSRAVALLEQALARPGVAAEGRVEAAFELAQALDQSGDAVMAMRAFARAHAARAPVLAPGRELTRILERPLPDRAISPSPAPAHGEDGAADPIFVVGFPRSGTTLLEQLLDAHPALASFDEQPFLQRLIQRLEQSGTPYPDALATLAPEHAAELRAAYRSDVARVLPHGGARRAVDKNPLNLVRLPLIAALFPRAPVIVALRHPCDVVLSCHMQSFRAPFLAEAFRTIHGAADLYDRVMRYAEASRAWLPRAPIELRYEDLVDDTDRYARALVDALGLTWDDALLEFTTRAADRGRISTPSYAGVAQPVHRAAVGRWRRYREWFDAPTLALLGPWCERFGYAL